MRTDLSTADTRVLIDQIETPSLGNHSYVVTIDDRFVVIDPQRDIERFEAVYQVGDAKLVGVLETHIHNDYVSGGFWLAERYGAPYFLPPGSGATYSHAELGDREAFDMGGWEFMAIDTPGHTFNHSSYALNSPDGVVAVFTGGSMLVGAVGRSDLLGPEATDSLLALQYRSVAGLASSLPTPAIVAPTHGAGSFCSASAVAGTTSTIGAERSHNPVCTAGSEQEFVSSQKRGYGLFPTYYSQMAAANLTPMPLAQLEPIKGMSVKDAIESGCDIIDARPFSEYAAGHIRGSISLPPSGQDATYLAWTLPWNSPIVVVGTHEAVRILREHLARIGWDRVAGRVDSSTVVASVASSEGEVETATTQVAAFADVVEQVPSVLIDARDPVDHAAGMIKGAYPSHVSEIAMGSVAGMVASGDSSDVWVHCQSGYRAAVATGFLERAGYKVTAVIDNLTPAYVDS